MIYVHFTEYKYYKFFELTDTRIHGDIPRGVNLDCEPAVNGKTAHAYNCKLQTTLSWRQFIRPSFLFTSTVELPLRSSSFNLDILQEFDVQVTVHRDEFL